VPHIIAAFFYPYAMSNSSRFHQRVFVNQHLLNINFAKVQRRSPQTQTFADTPPDAPRANSYIRPISIARNRRYRHAAKIQSTYTLLGCCLLNCGRVVSFDSIAE
jgi:hypothetical protein